MRLCSLFFSYPLAFIYTVHFLRIYEPLYFTNIFLNVSQLTVVRTTLQFHSASRPYISFSFIENLISACPLFSYVYSVPSIEKTFSAPLVPVIPLNDSTYPRTRWTLIFTALTPSLFCFLLTFLNLSEHLRIYYYTYHLGTPLRLILM